jgi:hypothetical protein
MAAPLTTLHLAIPPNSGQGSGGLHTLFGNADFPLALIAMTQNLKLGRQPTGNKTK